MPDQLLRCTPTTQDGATILTLEGRVHGRTWRPLGTLRPDVRVTARDTLNLDIFAPHVTWQSASRARGVLTLKGSDGGVRVSTQVTVHSHDMLRVETRISTRRSIRLELARDVLQLAAPVRRLWAPLQTPLPEMVVGDFAFHTPLVCVEGEHACLALIPNIRLLVSHRRVPTAVTCDATRGELAYGCMPYHLVHDTYCVHYDTDTVEVSGVVAYAYYIYYEHDVKAGAGLRRAARRLWQLYAVTRAQHAEPQRKPFEDVRLSVRTLPLLTPHDAYAAALAAQRTNDAATRAAADELIESFLTTPQRDGLFVLPSEYGPPGHETLCRLADCSWAGYWLCCWFRDLAADERILRFVTAYAQRLCTLQKHGGFFPTWIDPATGRATRWLPRSAEAAVHVIFLAALHTIAPDERWERAARRAANFLIREVIAHSRWECTETFWHVSPGWKVKRPGKPDPRQGTFSSHVLALWWCAEALLQLYRVTGTPRYLSWGTRVLDELAVYQQIWDAPFVSVPTFGGFAAANTDIQWNCIVQSLCAKTFLDYGRVTGLSEYFARGVAALRAQYGVIERRAVRTSQDTAQLSLLSEKSGDDLPTAYCPVNPLKPDTEVLERRLWQLRYWSALGAAETIWREYGDVYVDTRRVQAYGINGVVVKRTQADLAGIAVFGRELLGVARTLTVRTDTGETIRLKVKPSTPFEVQL